MCVGKIFTKWFAHTYTSAQAGVCNLINGLCQSASVTQGLWCSASAVFLYQHVVLCSAVFDEVWKLLVKAVVWRSIVQTLTSGTSITSTRSSQLCLFLANSWRPPGMIFQQFHWLPVPVPYHAAGGNLFSYYLDWVFQFVTVVPV